MLYKDIHVVIADGYLEVWGLPEGSQTFEIITIKELKF